MKKSQIVKLILFPTVLGLSIAAIDIFLFRPMSDEITAYGAFYSQIEDSLDFVIMGNSTVREGFIPTRMWKEHNITSRTFSASPTHPEVIKIAIPEIIDKQHPKAIFVDINGLTFQEKKNSEFFVKQYYSSVKDEKHKEELEKIYPYLEDDAGYELFNNHNNFRQQQYWESLVYPQQFMTKGYFPNSQIASIKPLEVDESEVKELTEDGAAYYREIIEVAETYKDSTSFIFGKMPRFNATMEDVDATYMLRSVKDDILSRGFGFVDWSEEAASIGLNPQQDFKDVEHLNHLGAIKFTHHLGEYLKANFALSDLSHPQDVIDDFEDSYAESKDYLDGIEKKLLAKIN